MIQADKFSRWKQQYTLQVKRSVNYYNELNQKQPVHTRQMTEEEKSEVFGKKKESCHKLKITELRRYKND